MHDSSRTLNERLTDKHPHSQSNKSILEAWDNFAEMSEWVPGTPPPFFERSLIPRNPGKILKNQQFPHINLFEGGGILNLSLFTRYASVRISVDQVMGYLRWNMEGMVTYASGRTPAKWDLPDEDLELIGFLDDERGDIWRARQKDDADMRRWPYMRKIAGISYTKASKDKRMGAKGEVPEARKKAAIKAAQDRPNPGAGLPRCPKGFRRIGKDCIEKSAGRAT